MPKAYTPFVADVCQRLSPLGDVRARAMFGGWGVYLGEAMFALVAGDVLYMKVDEETEGYFKGAGSRPFEYHQEKTGRRVSMSYFEAPEGTLDDAEALCEWARLATAAANRTAAKKRPRKSAAAKTKPAAPTKRAAKKKPGPRRGRMNESAPHGSRSRNQTHSSS